MTKPKLKEAVLAAAPPAPPIDFFEATTSLLTKYGDKRYAEGYRRASERIAQAIGALDADSKAKLSAALDQLEMELHQAEERSR